MRTAYFGVRGSAALCVGAKRLAFGEVERAAEPSAPNVE